MPAARSRSRSGDLIDVRYGLDAQYLDDGESYLVSAVVDPDLGYLVSRATEPTENFGGDEVIGVSETDVDCPKYEDPMRTLHTDGTPIDGGVLDPFFDGQGSHRRRVPDPVRSGGRGDLPARQLAAQPRRPLPQRGQADRAVESPARFVERRRPVVDDDLLGRAVGPAPHEHATGDRLAEDALERDTVRRELAAVAADAVGCARRRRATGRSCSRR